MSDFLQDMGAWVWTNSLHASALALLVLVALWLFRTTISPGWRYGLMVLVLFRLFLPFAPESALSVWNLAPAPAHASTAAEPLLAVEAPVQLPGSSRAEGAVSDFQLATPIKRRSSSVAETFTALPPPADMPIAESSGAPPSLGMLWALGVLGVLIWALWRHLRVMRWLRREARLADAPLAALFAECGGGDIPLLEVARLRTAAAVGTLRPKVIVPIGLGEELNPEEVRHIFRHELAHIRKGDLWLNWIVVLATALHWFNPLVWLAMRRLLIEREVARDHDVVRGGDAAACASYGRTLVKIVEHFQPAKLSPGAAPVFNQKPEIRRRIAMIAKHKRWNSRLCRLFCVALAAALGAATFTSARADDDDDREERRERGDREHREHEERERGERDREHGEREHEEREHREREHGDGEHGERDRERGERDRERGERDREHGERDRERGERDRERGEPDRERGEREQNIERQMHELERAIVEARERGQEDRAEMLMRKMRQLQEERHHRGEAEGFERKIEQARRRVHELAESGRIEQAENLEREIAQALEKRERQMAEREEHRAREHADRAHHEQAERHLHELERAIHEARERGQEERAEKLMREMREFQEGLQARREHAEREHRESEHAERAEREENLEHRIREMAERIEHLERVIEELRRDR